MENELRNILINACGDLITTEQAEQSIRLWASKEMLGLVGKAQVRELVVQTLGGAVFKKYIEVSDLKQSLKNWSEKGVGK